MPLVIYLGWHVFTCNTGLLKPSEKTPLTFAALQKGSQALVEQEGLMFLETLNDASEALSKWLAEDSQRTATLVWLKPHAFIAAFIAQGKPPEPVIQQWKKNTQAALKLFRHHRSQLTLVGTAPGEHWTDGSTDYTRHISTEAFMPSVSEVSALYSLAAMQLVDNDSSLQETLTYITASSHACSTPEESSKGIVENALLSLKTLQSEQEQAKVHTQDIVAKQQSAEAEIIRFQTQLKDVSDQRNKANTETELLLTQLHAAQEALETVIRQQEQDEQQSKNALEVEKKRHHAAAKSLKNAEIKISNLMQQHVEMKNENRLLLEQLHSVQEELESKYFGQELERYVSASELQRQIEVNKLQSQEKIHRLQSTITWLRAHAYRHAAAAYRSSRTYKKALLKQVALLEASDYFNAEWYRDQYRDVAAENINPAEHFIKFGAIEGRNPSSIFDTESYLANNNDVAVSGHHPLMHYLRHGIFEERVVKQENPQ